MASRRTSRRSFLRTAATSAAAVPALALPAIVPARVFGEDAPSNTRTIAFIGTGNNGTNWLRHFLADPRMRVVAVCDVNREGPGYWGNSVRGREPARKLVDEFYKDRACGAYEDFREVIGRKDVDAIYIGTPDHWHALIAIAAARAGKDVYGQKPLSLTIAEGRAMSDAVKKAGIVWQTGSQQRSNWRFRRAVELVRNGRIGKLQTVYCGLPGGIPDYGRTAARTTPEPVPEGFNYDMWLGPAPEAPYCPARVGVNFRWILDYSGGQITDWGGHHPDIAQWGMNTERTGPVAIKNAHGKFAEHPIYNTATEFSFECHYASGVTLVITSHGIDVGGSRRGGVKFEGTEGWVWADRGGFEASSPKIRDAVIEKGELKLVDEKGGASGTLHVKDFIDCVFSRATPVAPIEVAHRSITLAHLGNIALRTGRSIRWDPERERIVGDAGASDMLSRPYRAPWRLEG